MYKRHENETEVNINILICKSFSYYIVGYFLTEFSASEDCLNIMNGILLKVFIEEIDYDWE